MKRKYRYIATKKITKVKIPKKKFCKGFGDYKGECKFKPNLKNKFKFCDRCYTYWKEHTLAKALRSRRGRERLTASMASPIIRRLDYESIVRRAFNVQPLPGGPISYSN